MSEWTATLVCQATAILTAEDRRAVDAELAPCLPSMSERQAASAARAAAYRIDPTSVVRRVRGAESDRCVSVRPAPDCMARLSALLPVKDGVAVYAALRASADKARAVGDTRTQGQVMADTLTTRTTGYASSDEIPVQVNLVMSDTTLLAGGGDAGRVQGYGPVPAPWARHVATAPDLSDVLHVPDSRGSHQPEGGGAASAGSEALDEAGGRSTPERTAADRPNARARVWLRRLYTSPDGSALVAMDSRRRVFDGQLRHLIRLRDQTCRTPYCDAPIRHTDHIVGVALDGPTSTANSAGVCERCNDTKALPGWTAQTVSGRPAESPHALTVATPTGHTYHSTAPPPLGHGAIGPATPVAAGAPEADAARDEQGASRDRNRDGPSAA